MGEKELIKAVAAIGKGLVSCGAEIYRAEESMKRICAAYGHENAEVFAVPSVIIVTVFTGGGTPVTEICRIYGRSTNLDRVDKYNALSRMICRTKPTYQTVVKHIASIEKRICYTKRFTGVSYAIAGAATAFTVGGGVKDCFLAAFAALIIYAVSVKIDGLNPGVFMRSAVCSMFAAAFCAAMNRLGLIPAFDKAIIGAVVTLVPGVAITNCMRDLLAGDLLAGLYTMTEAFLTAAGIAVGTGAVIAAAVM